MSVGVLFCKKLNKNVYRELIGQQTARQPMEKYNVHLTSKSEKKINAKILKLIIKPIAKVSFWATNIHYPLQLFQSQQYAFSQILGLCIIPPKITLLPKSALPR